MTCSVDGSGEEFEPGQRGTGKSTDSGIRVSGGKRKKRGAGPFDDLDKDEVERVVRGKVGGCVSRNK